MLEGEIQAVDAKISAFKTKKLTVPDELVDRKQALEIKMNMLILQVQTGSLTMEGQF